MLQGERDVTQQEICAINTVTRNDSFFGFLVPLCYDKRRVWFWAALTVWQEMAFHATSTISSLFWMFNGHDIQKLSFCGGEGELAVH